MIIEPIKSYLTPIKLIEYQLAIKFFEKFDYITVLSIPIDWCSIGFDWYLITVLDFVMCFMFLFCVTLFLYLFEWDSAVGSEKTEYDQSQLKPTKFN